MQIRCVGLPLLVASGGLAVILTRSRERLDDGWLDPTRRLEKAIDRRFGHGKACVISQMTGNLPRRPLGAEHGHFQDLLAFISQ